MQFRTLLVARASSFSHTQTQLCATWVLARFLASSTWMCPLSHHQLMEFACCHWTKRSPKIQCLYFSLSHRTRRRLLTLRSCLMFSLWRCLLISFLSQRHLRGHLPVLSPFVPATLKA